MPAMLARLLHIVRRPIPCFLAFLALIVAPGCGGTQSLSPPNVGQMADANFPRVRSAAAHPDSLRQVSIMEEADRIRIRLQGSYDQLHRSWSSTFQFMSPQREIQDPLTYATLWSKELSLAALQAEGGLATLPKETARTQIQERRKRYREVLRVDVYWFSGPDGSPITGPGARVELRDGDGNTYTPSREEDTPLRNASIIGGATALYRRSTFYFQRTQEGEDILDGVQELYLRISPTGGPTVRFGWKWEE